MGLKVLDLFCGCGGLSTGFEAAGFIVVGGNDFDDAALEAFKLNHQDALTWSGPIEDLPSERVLDDLGLRKGELDVLVGGPPCQGFSKNRARRHVAGAFVDDPRNYLFKEYLRFVEELRPRAIVIENVPELLIKEQGRFATEIESRLGDLGYSMSAGVLNAADYGVPQRRRRAIILAARAGPIALPAKSHGESMDDGLFPLEPYRTIRDAIGDLAGLGEGETWTSYRREPTTTYQKERRVGVSELTEHHAWRMSEVQRERLTYLGEGDGAEKLPPHLAPKSGYGSAYRRMAWDIPALTITTWMYHPGSGMFYHPYDARTITVREAARLQSFDDNVRFIGGKTARCRQVGNAVPALLAAAIAGSVRARLVK
ncbi:MAG TPA: DNA cytosine methyltransferase [Acidimicrobiales bacterium]|nr:DNA cytosine methyltransferase [Acidimicrobiales bacterium]